jgi:hypothetical protein
MARMGFSTGTMAERPPLLAKPMAVAGRPPTDFGVKPRIDTHTESTGPGEGGLFARMPATQVPQTMGFSGAPSPAGVGMPAPMPSGGISATVPASMPATPQMRPYGGRRRGYDPGWR